MSKNKKRGGFPVFLLILGAVIAAILLIKKAPLWILIVLASIIVGIIAIIAGSVRAYKKGQQETAEKMKASTVTKNDVIVPVNKQDPEVAKALEKARRYVTEERIILSKTANSEVREASLKVVDLASKILAALNTKPEKVASSSQFLNYYLPTLGIILQKYRKLELSGLDITGTPEKVINYMGDIERAMQKEYTNLFENDRLDLSVEMEAMTIACKRDGLLTDEDLTKAYQTQAINLKL